MVSTQIDAVKRQAFCKYDSSQTGGGAMIGQKTRGEYLLKGGSIVSMDSAIGVLPRGDVAIADGCISEVGANLDAPNSVVIDASNMIIMPGLIDSHFHMWSSIAKNLLADDYVPSRHGKVADRAKDEPYGIIDLPHGGYYRVKWATSSKYEPEDVYASVLFGLVESLAAGITTVHNWSHNTRSPAHADAELRAHAEGLIRARFSYGHRDRLPTDESLDYTDIDRATDEWFGLLGQEQSLVRLGVNLRGPDWVPQEIFDREMFEARERDLPVAIHTTQGPKSKVAMKDLEAKGYTGSSLLICHFLAATSEDREILARTGTPLSFAVHSEMRLGTAGDTRSALLDMLADGVTVSLSIDATSLGPINLFEAMNVAWNIGIPWERTESAHHQPITFRQCLEMATINGARALGLESITGSLTPGKRADVIMIRADDLNVAPVGDIEGTVVRSVTPSNVDTVFVDGRLLKRRGRLVVHDEKKVVEEGVAALARIRERAGM